MEGEEKKKVNKVEKTSEETEGGERRGENKPGQELPAILELITHEKVWERQVSSVKPSSSFAS